jgi:hypothetical protein
VAPRVLGTGGTGGTGGPAPLQQSRSEDAGTCPAS